MGGWTWAVSQDRLAYLQIGQSFMDPRNNPPTQVQGTTALPAGSRRNITPVSQLKSHTEFMLLCSPSGPWHSSHQEERWSVVPLSTPQCHPLCPPLAAMLPCHLSSTHLCPPLISNIPLPTRGNMNSESQVRNHRWVGKPAVGSVPTTRPGPSSGRGAHASLSETSFLALRRQGA